MKSLFMPKGRGVMFDSLRRFFANSDKQELKPPVEAEEQPKKFVVPQHLTRTEMYRLLDKAYAETDWNDNKSVREYSEYSFELLKRLYIKED